MAAGKDLNNSLDLGVIVIEDDRRISVWNDWIAHKAQIPAAKALGRTLAELFPALEGAPLLAAVERVFSAGLPTIMSHHFHPRVLPLVEVRGRVVEPVEQSVVVRPLLTGEGRQAACLIQVSDLTSAVKRDRHLRKITAYSRTLFDMSADALVTVDGEGRMLETNPSFETLTGRSGAGLQGQPFCEVFLSVEEARSFVRQAFADRLRHDVTLTLRHADGGLRHVLLNAAVIPGAHSDDPCLYISARDISHRIEAQRQLARKSDELERSNAELSAFAYVASHDLRQPLRMISSYLGLIERRLGTALPDDLREFLSFAVDGARRMDRLILDLLEYSRVGHDDGRREAVDVAEVVNDSLLNLKLAIEESQAELVVGALPVIESDRLELLRLFQNLIGNALKYRSLDRLPRIEVGYRGDGGEHCFFVRDNGIGIAAEQSDRAFGIFQRLVPAEQYEGTVIGLAICKKIVEHRGGRIWVDSRPGFGSTFFFTVPEDAAAS